MMLCIIWSLLKCSLHIFNRLYYSFLDLFRCSNPLSESSLSLPLSYSPLFITYSRSRFNLSVSFLFAFSFPKYSFLCNTYCRWKVSWQPLRSVWWYGKRCLGSSLEPWWYEHVKSIWHCIKSCSSVAFSWTLKALNPVDWPSLSATLNIAMQAAQWQYTGSMLSTWTMRGTRVMSIMSMETSRRKKDYLFFISANCQPRLFVKILTNERGVWLALNPPRSANRAGQIATSFQPLML